jgi:hypothetical protein
VKRSERNGRGGGKQTDWIKPQHFVLYRLRVFENRALRRVFETRALRRVFENRVLRRVFRPKREEMRGGLRKLRNEELHKLYFSSNIITAIKSRRMKWAGHLARMGETRNAYKHLV